MATVNHKFNDTVTAYFDLSLSRRIHTTYIFRWSTVPKPDYDVFCRAAKRTDNLSTKYPYVDAAPGDNATSFTTSALTRTFKAVCSCIFRKDGALAEYSYSYAATKSIR